MPFYRQQGELPRKKHTAVRKPDGGLLREELFSTQGFAGAYSTRYRLDLPTRVQKVRELPPPQTPAWPKAPLQPYHFFSLEKPAGGDFLTARRIFLENDDVRFGTIQPNRSLQAFYRNASAHELVFIHRGAGVLQSEYGRLQFAEGDYLVIPKGVTVLVEFAALVNNALLLIESAAPFEIPRHYRSEGGQILEHAPYCERVFRAPELGEPHGEPGDFRLLLQTRGRLFEYALDRHPFDVAAWDGYHYPFAFNIADFNPVVGKLHLPPPVHAVFHTRAAMVSNFVPRLADFHPEAVPIPYYHSNIDCDEVLYYVRGNFMSRRAVREGSVTLHPGGVPHGPQPGKIEAALGLKALDEWAVMLDTFAPLRLTGHVRKVLDKDYARSWSKP